MAVPPILSVKEMSFSYHHHTVLEDVTLHLYAGDTACLMGCNGSGKSSLLRVLAGLRSVDAGDMFIQPGLTVSYLPQHSVPEAQQLIEDYVVQGALAHPQYTDKVRFLSLSLLEELGLPLGRAMGQLSGGQIQRASLIAALIQPCAIFLLDEPTNQMDIVGIEWLEKWIKASSKTFVIVSHDRAFLKNITNKVLWLENKKVHVCPTGFEGFGAWQDIFLTERERTLEKIDTKLAQETHWLHRGVTARRKRNQGRLRHLQLLRKQRIQVVQDLQKKSLSLHQTEGMKETKQILLADGLSYGHNGDFLFRDVSFRLLKGDRLGIVGPNGCGKSTLIKILVGALQPQAGTIERPKELSYGWFQQDHPIENLALTPWQFLCPTGGDSIRVQGRSQHVVGYLKDFLFTSEQARAEISLLSGGQRNRLRLAQLLARDDPLLILDEPTNDLDMETLDFLADFLAEYKGTLIIISHDRDFLDQVVTSLLVFENPVREYFGGFSDYLQQCGKHHPFLGSASKREKSKNPPQEKSRSATKDRLSYHEVRLLEVLPQQIALWEKERNSLEKAMADCATAGEHGTLSQHAQELSVLVEKIAAAEHQWLALVEQQDRLSTKAPCP